MEIIINIFPFLKDTRMLEISIARTYPIKLRTMPVYPKKMSPLFLFSFLDEFPSRSKLFEVSRRKSMNERRNFNTRESAY